MSSLTDNPLHRNTPTVTVLDNRGLVARTLDYYRHPDAPTQTEPRITRHAHDARGFPAHSSDPRLHAAGRVNSTWVTDLAGNPLCTQSVDAGVSIRLPDAAGRTLLAVTRIAVDAQGGYSSSQAVTRTWHYEPEHLPGRLLGISEQVEGQAPCRLERLVYGGNSAESQAFNLAGQLHLHYDTAGLLATCGISLTGVTLASSRRLLADADNPQVTADWHGDEPSQWDAQLETQAHVTSHTLDATGQVLTTLDAAGHLQRQAYDVAGLFKASWLTLKDGREQAIVEALAYSAAGQKLREVYGNGLLTEYRYAPRTQRLVGIRTERPSGHALGAKVLQDLHYAYDPVGNVTSVRNEAEHTRFWRNQKVEPHSAYVYDSLYQLVSASGREMANAGRQGQRLPERAALDNHTYSRYTRSYRYDCAGNLTRIRHSAPASDNSYTLEITVSERSNRALSRELAERPDQVETLFTADGLQTALYPGQPLAWTARGELFRVTPVERGGEQDDSEHYRYDIANQRILKVATRKAASTVQTQRVLYLPGLELRSTRNDAALTEDLQVATLGQAGRAQVRALQWRAGRPQDMPDDPLRYSYDDLLGSAALEVDGSGAVISREEYYPYGCTAVWAARSEVQGRYKFIRHAGKERDATGLYYYGYRYYQPGLGRWLSADPAGTVDGLNLFAMVGNNPVSRVDEQGLMFKSVTDWWFGKSGSSSQDPQPMEQTPASPEATTVQHASKDTSGAPEPMDTLELQAPTLSTPTKKTAPAQLPSKPRKKQPKRKVRSAADPEDGESGEWEVAGAKPSAKQKSSAVKQREPVHREFGTKTVNKGYFERNLGRLPTDRQRNLGSILGIGQRPGANGKEEIVFIDQGTGTQGFKHVIEEHRADFRASGISPDTKVINLLMTALVHGQVVDTQGATRGRAGRPIYEVEFEDQIRYVAVQLKDDNSLLGANPKDQRWEDRFRSSRTPT